MFLYFKKYTWIPVIIIFLIVEVLINPIGEFCLNDDWAYAQAVNNFQTTSELKFSFWQAIPGLPLIFTGILFSKIFGFSFTLLRFISVGSIIIIALIFDSNLKRFGISAINRFMVLMLLVFNPLTISLGNSFMPDVFQLLLAILTFHFMILYIEEKRIFHYGLLVLFGLILCLNRQIGIVIPLIFSLIFIIREKRSIQNISLAMLPFLVSLLGLVIFEYVAEIKQILPQNYNLQTNNIIKMVSHPALSTLKIISYYFITSSICLGLFILPLTISGIKECFYLLKKSIFVKIILLFYLLLIICKIIFSHNIFPFVGNMFYHLGTGPIILTGLKTEDTPDLSIFIQCFWISLNIIGGLSFFISIRLIINMSLKSITIDQNYLRLFFIMLLLLYLIPFCFNYANDRYLLFLIPFYFIAYFVAFNQEINKLYFAILFIPLFYFSISSSHDYISINGARMKATDYLVVNKSISPQRIDGGFEFNGWHSKDKINYIPSHKGRWWFIDKDDYIVSPMPLNGYSIDTSFAFSSWMSFDFNELLVLKKQE